MKKIYIFGALACLLAACKPNVNVVTTPLSGTADFTNYLAIGNSLTAGYSDNSLTVSGQLNSYPERLFEQFALVVTHGAKGPFKLPLLASDIGYPSAKLVLRETYGACGPADSSLGPVPYPNWVANPADAVFYNSGVNNNQVNNIGVPGIRVVDYPVAGYSQLNPYAARFYHADGLNPVNTNTPMDELQYRVSTLHPTFFTLWLGANDVLGYALAGGQGDGSAHALPFALNLYNKNDISNIDTFEKIYDSILNLSISTGAKGALINIPSIDSLPYFNVVPMKGLLISRQTQADSLQALYRASGYNIVFQIGYNYFVIKDNNGNIRQAVPGERLLMSVPQDKLLCGGWGSVTPIPEQYVLTTDELQHIRYFTTQANEFILQRAQLHQLAYVDMYSFLGQLFTGITYNGINYSAQYVSGGAFSLDGIHPTQRGYALIANQIITTINQQYHSTVPMVDVNRFHGVDFQ